MIDVGYAGVIGAERIASEGQMPYGHMPTDDGKECGKADADGYVRERIQENGRCESANDRGDTYGPVSYLAYVPGFAIFGWSGKWETSTSTWRTSRRRTSPPSSSTCSRSSGWALVGRRFGGIRLGVTLAFAWAAYPFTQYVSNSNSNDALMPALLIWGFWLLNRAPARGFFLALASWTKFASLLLLPLWASYPRALSRRSLWTTTAFAGGFLLATAPRLLGRLPRAGPPACAPPLLGPDLRVAARPAVAILDLALGRVPGYPDLHLVQSVLKVLLLVASVALAFVPRVKTSLAGRSAVGSSPDRLRARPDALVLPLHPLVLPVRRVRPARPRRQASRAPAGRVRCPRGSRARPRRPGLGRPGLAPRSRSGVARDRLGGSPCGAVDRLSDRRHAGLPALRRGDDLRAGALPGLPARVSAGGPAGVLCSPPSAPRTTTGPSSRS